MLEEHLGYVADRVRLERFRAAIAGDLQPGVRGADLACGSGILGLLSLQAGAARARVGVSLRTPRKLADQAEDVGVRCSPQPTVLTRTSRSQN